jgi:predicted amidohydrolase
LTPAGALPQPGVPGYPFGVPRNPQSQTRFLCACVQFNVRRADIDKNRASAIAGMRAAAEEGARLVVLPEMWPTSFVTTVTDALLDASRASEQAVIDLARELDLVVVGGGLEREDGHLFNRALVVESGTVLGSYRKIHLFSPHAENRYLTAGSDPLIVETRLGRIGVLICYDLRFPELVRHYFSRKTDLLAVPSQWPEARSEHWRVLLKARAIENEMFVVGCNRTGVEASLKNEELLSFPGDSRIIDPMGEVLGSGAGEDGPVLGEVALRKVETMRRILPIRKDRRIDVYERLWQGDWRRAASPAPRGRPARHV